LERSGTAGRLAGTVGVGGSTSLARHPHLATSATQAQGAVFATGARDVGTLALFPALRVDAVSAGAWRAAVSPSLGANLRLRDFRLKGQAARAFRAPTLNDLYWQPGGNPSLRPERSTAFDAGASWEPAAPAFRPSLEVTVYTHRIREQIVWLPEASGIWSPRNVARVRARGVEASAEAAPRWGPVRGEARILYTLTDARDRSDPSSAAFDRPLRYVPRHQGKTALAVVLTRGGWEVALDVAGRFTSRRYVTTDASQFVREYAVVDAGGRFGRRIGAARVGVSVALENVFDANYEGIKGYPMPPRRLHVSARIDLRR
jgi:iron complex outermembrane receptor protein